MTEYVVLIVGDADRWWSQMTEEQRKEGYAVHDRFSEELMKRGHQITGGAELHHEREARTIPPGGGTPTDGPYLEITEQVGGFYVVRTEDVDDLLDVCQLLAQQGDAIEVRQVVEAEERPQ